MLSEVKLHGVKTFSLRAVDYLTSTSVPGMGTSF